MTACAKNIADGGRRGTCADSPDGTTRALERTPCTRYGVSMAKAKTVATTEVTMREFRASPAKILRRAARTDTKLRIGEFVLVVEAAAREPSVPILYGAMEGTGHIVGDPRGLLSADAS
jgi:hypothetical protein